MVFRCTLVARALLLGLVLPLDSISSSGGGARDSQFLLPDGGRGEPGEERLVACVLPEHWQQIEAEIAANRKELAAKQVLAPNPQLRVLFQWPLRVVGSAANGLDPYRMSGFVDDEYNVAGAIRDYHCGARTYNGHRGTDISVWPFGWLFFDANEVLVVAAAKGTIVGKSGGNFDENCGPSSDNWNAVYLEHDDGTVTWYGHLKKGSLTSKAVGARVAVGEYLGVMGSSGNSSGLHLHFEVHDQTGRVLDPFAGKCNDRNLYTLWEDQRPYFKSGITRLLIGTAPVQFQPCPGRPTTNEAQAIVRGTPAVMTAFYVDQFSSQVSAYRIRRPSGTIFQSWTHMPPTSYSYSYWYWTWTIPTGAPTGVWTFEVDFAGKTYVKEFIVV